MHWKLIVKGIGLAAQAVAAVAGVITLTMDEKFENKRLDDKIDKRMEEHESKKNNKK